MNAQVTVLLPAYNEQGKVGNVIDQLISIDPNLSIIVVDDGSSDSTYNEAADRNIIVVKHIVNFGQWAALRTGFHIALLNQSDYLVTVDADGQHSPENLTIAYENGGTGDVIEAKIGGIGWQPTGSIESL